MINFGFLAVCCIKDGMLSKNLLNVIFVTPSLLSFPRSSSKSLEMVRTKSPCSSHYDDLHARLVACSQVLGDDFLREGGSAGHRGVFDCGGVVFKTHYSRFINRPPLEKQMFFQNTNF